MILVVEDNADIREMVCLLLEGGGYPTATASNGQEALDWLHSEAVPSVILLDLTMPVMDGYRFLTAKEADQMLTDVPVIVMTATTDCPPLRGHRVCECIHKPFSAHALFDAIAISGATPAPPREPDSPRSKGG